MLSRCGCGHLFLPRHAGSSYVVLYARLTSIYAFLSPGLVRWALYRASGRMCDRPSANNSHLHAIVTSRTLMIGSYRSLLETIMKPVYQSLQIWRSMVVQNLFGVHSRFRLNIFLKLIFLFGVRQIVFQIFLNLSLGKKWLIFLQVILASLDHVPSQLRIFLAAVELTLQILQISIKHQLISLPIL